MTGHGVPPTALKCFLFNARSLANKLHHLHLFLSSYEPDLLFVTETWFSSEISDSEVSADSPYKLFRKDRKGRKGGGICCLAKNTLSSMLLMSLPASTLTSLVLMYLILLLW